MSKAILTAILISAIALWPIPARTQQASPISTEQILPEKILIDAYDAAHVNGLVFITGQQNAVEQNCFGVRFIASGLDGAEDSPRKFQLGPHAPDGKFASVSWQPKFAPKTTITLRWHRAGKQIVVGQLSASANVRLTMEAYRPFSDARDGLSWPVYAAKDSRSILGEQIHNQKIKAPLNRFLLKTDRTALAKSAEAESALAARAKLAFDLSANAPVGFIATVGDEFAAMEREADKLKSITEVLDKAEKEFAAIGTATGGALGDSFETIARATMWNRFYSASHRYEYITPHRVSGSGLRGDAMGVDSLLLSALTGLTNGESATASLRILLSGQTPDGRIPLRRYQQTEAVGESPMLAGRSMAPLATLAALKVYLATQDAVFLAWAYPRLQQANDWWHANRGDNRTWRDGNLDGLLEFGFNAELEYGALGAALLTNADKLKLAMAEAGTITNDVKYHDETHTLELDSVALNSLYALDTELLVLASRELGLTTETDRWQLRYDEIKKLVNEHLWSEGDKLYLDRTWDGAFTHRRALDLLLPLVAGIPEPSRAKLMMTTLRESKELTIASDADQALITYLLYLGMKRYGFDKEAAELAKQNLKAAKPMTELNPQRPLFAPLLVLPAIEELLATDPWQGLNFGNTVANEEARIERVKIAGSSFDIIIGPKRTVIRRDGKIEIEFEAPVKLRGYRSNDRVLACVVETKTEVRVLIPGEEGKKITASVDEKVLGSASLGSAASFKIKEGSHKLLVVK
ncbi:MAG: MGH1-like glycoside hydrolase domain-containing protein [Blastocatellia bacterium]